VILNWERTIQRLNGKNRLCRLHFPLKEVKKGGNMQGGGGAKGGQLGGGLKKLTEASSSPEGKRSHKD